MSLFALPPRTTPPYNLLNPESDAVGGPLNTNPRVLPLVDKFNNQLFGLIPWYVRVVSLKVGKYGRQKDRVT